MNKPNRHDLEIELSKTYHGQISHYQELVSLANQVQDAFKHDLETSDILLQMNEVMEKIVQSNNATTDTRSAWNQFSQQPGPELAKQVAAVEGLIRELMGIVDQAESVALQAKERLRPELEAEYQQVRMKNAYSKV